MYYFAAVQQTSTVKLPTFFQRFQAKVHVLRVNETKITIKNVANQDHFRTESNLESSNDEKTWFWAFLQI